MATPDKIMITRHRALVEYAREIGLIDQDTPVLPHVTEPSEIAGRHVIGPCPLRLAAHAASVTEIPIHYDRDLSLRGVELTLDQLRAMAGQPVKYVVREASAYADEYASALGTGAGIGCDPYDPPRSARQEIDECVRERRRKLGLTENP